MIRNSNEVIEEFLTEEGELPLDRMPEVLAAFQEELSKPVANQPTQSQFLSLLQAFTTGGLQMLAQQIGGALTEIGHLANGLAQAVDPEAVVDPDPAGAAQEATQLMLLSMELDRMRRILDLVWEVNRPKIEVAK